MSLKVQFLHSHLDFFSTDVGEVSDEHSKRFHQKIKEVENRYQESIIRNILACCCWFLQRENNTMHKRQAIRSKHFKRLTQQHLVRGVTIIAVAIVELKLEIFTIIH